VIVAQGWEAGGHNYGGLPIMVLVPEILDTVSPALVLASGGIVDGRGVAAARGLLPLYAKLTPTRSAAMIRAPLFAEPCGDRSGWYIADAEMRAPNARRRRTCRTRRIQWSCCRPARGHVWARRCLSQQNHPDPPHSAGFPLSKLEPRSVCWLAPVDTIGVHISAWASSCRRRALPRGNHGSRSVVARRSP
jgi:hypothetical protein